MRYSENDINMIRETLNSDHIAISTQTGAKTQMFEEIFSRKFGMKAALAVSSGTAGIHLALLSCGVSAGDEVLVDPLFEHGALAVLRCNAIPVFYDVNIDTYMPDLEHLIARISPRTKAIVITNLFGCTPNLPTIKKMCSNLNLMLIEDCAHAIMCKCRNRYAGTYGDIGVFSFHSLLHLSLGEGGMLITNNEVIYKKAKRMRDGGIWQQTDYIDYSFPLGWGYRISELVSALGVSQFEGLGRVINYCKDVGSWISSNLVSEYIIPQNHEYSDHVFWKWAGRVSNNKLFQHLEKSFENSEYVEFGLNNKTDVCNSDLFRYYRRTDVFLCPYDCIFSGENTKTPVELKNAPEVSNQLLSININYGTSMNMYKKIVKEIKREIDEWLSY